MTHELSCSQDLILQYKNMQEICTEELQDLWTFLLHVEQFCINTNLARLTRSGIDLYGVHIAGEGVLSSFETFTQTMPEKKLR